MNLTNSVIDSMMSFTFPFVRRGVNFVRSLHPSKRAEREKLSKLRTNVFSTLNQFSRQSTEQCFARKVLIDGLWYNPNYWARYAIFRKALNLSEAQETSIIGEHSRSETKEILDTYGITHQLDFHKGLTPSHHLQQAKALLEQVKSPQDIISLSLPHGFPSDVLYDGILKRQRRATVKLDDPMLVRYFAECLSYLENADAIISKGQYDLLVMSHALDFTYSALVWIALSKNIPVFVLYGEFGTSRFMRLNKLEDIYAYPNRPSISEMSDLPAEAQVALSEIGRSYLHQRLTGNTGDIGAIYAYQRRKASISHESMCRDFGWDSKKPVIGVYASNWFDYPHATKMSYFTDFLDWMNVTLDIAKNRTDVNWLFKSHPCDDWYATIRGSRVEDLISDANLKHIRAADKSWNGFDLISSLDGIVTCHGTIGIEATHLNTPVLTSHPGWYGFANFTKQSSSLEEYVANLKEDWWASMNTKCNAQTAEQFAGWFFAAPDWDKTYTFIDDSYQDDILETLVPFFDQHAASIEKEIEELKDWFASGHPYYHIFKMSRAKSFAIPIPPC